VYLIYINILAVARCSKLGAGVVAHHNHQTQLIHPAYVKSYLTDVTHWQP